MSIVKCFDIDTNKAEMISVIGGGGKTTTIFKLASELKLLNKRVLIATTTAIYNPSKDLYDNLVILDNDQSMESNWGNGTITVLGRCISLQNKIIGVDSDFLNNIFKKNFFDIILVEADGSKERPIKAPASHEPVIPSFTSKTIGVIGMDALGKTIDESNVHRPEIFSRVTSSKIGDTITEETILRVVTSKDGLYKGTPRDSKKYLLLNKADNELQINQARLIGDMIRESQFALSGIIAGSMANERIRRV